MKVVALAICVEGGIRMDRDQLPWIATSMRPAEDRGGRPSGGSSFALIRQSSASKKKNSRGLAHWIILDNDCVKVDTELMIAFSVLNLCPSIT